MPWPSVAEPPLLDVVEQLAVELRPIVSKLLAEANALVGEVLRAYDRVLVPEMNTGQLKTILRDQFLVDCKPLNKVSGHPFKIAEIEAAIDGMLV